MNTTKVKLGKIDNETIFIEKHKWDCDWYWGFGYIGNKSSHFHIDSLISSETDVNKVFEDTKISQSEWWIIRDLFIQAYALKKAAEVYRFGGHQTTVAGLTDIIKNANRATELNKDLERVLDLVWKFICDIAYR